MRLSSIRSDDGVVTPVVQWPGGSSAPIEQVLGRGGGDLMASLSKAVLDELETARRPDARPSLDASGARFAVPYRHPGKILGVGLNYQAHAQDLGVNAPRSSPVCFLKGDHTVIGPEETIVVPAGIGRVTAEAELGIVIGRDCHRVSTEEAMEYVAGVVAVLDQTAEDVLLQNPRYLTRAKNYSTFFSFGPEVITLPEVEDTIGDLGALEVRTILNDEVVRRDVVANMTFSPAELISFHSHVMPFHAGDIISTGTPGAVGIGAGDVVACELVGLSLLSNPVS